MPHVALAQRSSRVCIDAATQGQTLRDDGHLRAAKERFLACAAASCPPLVRQDCARWATEVETQTPTVVVGAKDAAGHDVAARVSLDGAPWIDVLDGRPRAVDPGQHQFHFEGAGAVVDLQVLVRAGEKSRNVVAVLPTEALASATAPAVEPSVAATMPPPRAPSPTAPEPRPTWPLWLFGGLAVASAGAATALVVHAHDQNDALRARCAPACTDEDTGTLRTDLVLANVAVGVGIASVAGLAYFAFFAPRSTPAPAALAPSGLRVTF